MARIVAVIRFIDGSRLFGLYETVTDSLSSSALFTTEQAASEHLNMGTSRLLMVDPTVDEEIVEILPYALKGDNSVYFISRASRAVLWITGPRNLDDVRAEMRATEY